MPLPKKSKTICIRADGKAEFIYDDDLKGIIDSSDEKKVFRASHVEPDGTGQWWADLSPIKGPKLGPFTLRAEALQAEVDWIKLNYLGSKTTGGNEQGTV
jgi:hypothetical protein